MVTSEPAVMARGRGKAWVESPSDNQKAVSKGVDAVGLEEGGLGAGTKT